MNTEYEFYLKIEQNSEKVIEMHRWWRPCLKAHVFQKVLDSDTCLVVLHLYTKSVDFKSTNPDVSQVQTFSFN